MASGRLVLLPLRINVEVAPGGAIITPGGPIYPPPPGCKTTREDVIAWYERYLGRAPQDPQEIVGWLGADCLAVELTIATSPEAVAYIGDHGVRPPPAPLPPVSGVPADANPWTYPVTDVIGSPRSTPVSNVHTGVDYGMPCGTRIAALRSGRVLAEGWTTDGYTGIWVHTRADDGTYITFAHLNDTLVSAGDRLVPSTIVGHTGRTSSRDLSHAQPIGCHLHLEAHRSEGHIGTMVDIVDPLVYFADLKPAA